MDHEVQDHIHIQAARAKQVHPVHLEEEGQAGAAFQFQHGRVETFQMADLQDPAIPRGGGDQPVGRSQAAGDGLFHQEIDAGFEQPTSHLFMGGGGHGHDGGIHLARQIARFGESQRRAGSAFGGARGIAVYHRHQFR